MTVPRPNLGSTAVERSLNRGIQLERRQTASLSVVGGEPLLLWVEATLQMGIDDTRRPFQIADDVDLQVCSSRR
jgi:hypothetical protein